MTDGNDLAYPLTHNDADDIFVVHNGLSKREFFAAIALQGLLVNFVKNEFYGNSPYYPFVSEMAVSQADELIEALNKPQK